MALNLNRKKKNDTIYHLGKECGEKAAYAYEKRNPKKDMSFWKSVNPFSNYAERFIKGYNDGYFGIVNGRKMIKASQKIETLKKEEREKRAIELKAIQAKKQGKTKERDI